MFAILIVYLAVICVFGFPSTAHAYIDPGTGSLLLQSLAAGFLAVGIYFRRVQAFVKDMFARRSQRKGQ
jgi:hypothetical protein